MLPVKVVKVEAYGVDLQAISADTSVVCALQPESKQSQTAPSRGELAAGFLQGTSSPVQYLLELVAAVGKHDSLHPHVAVTLVKQLMVGRFLLWKAQSCSVCMLHVASTTETWLVHLPERLLCRTTTVSTLLLVTLAPASWHI